MQVNSFWRHKCDIKLRRFQNRCSAHVEFESKCDTGSNTGDWNHIEITQTIPELHTGKGQN
jgi:hypothetical protein